jgi:hypothetical protein
MYMKYNFYLYISVCLSAICVNSQAQTLKAAAVPVSAVVSKSPAQIKLRWPRDTGATRYQVFRKTKSETTWGTALDSLQLTDTTYTDNLVVAGSAYEYKIDATKTPEHTFGFIYAGIEIPAIESRGKIMIVVDTTYKAEFWPEFLRLEEDMRGDGWMVHRFMVDTNVTVSVIKDSIRAQYMADPTGLKSVLLFGNVAVPYSGNLFPDGHPDHTGAWPADLYYGEMHAAWTDFLENTANNPVGYQPTRIANQNFPADGKFDESVILDSVDLQVGRVDLSNLPAFSQTEGQLLKRYLDKDHSFRHRIFAVKERAVIQDNFASYPEKFGANGWRNFAPMFTDTNITEASFDNSLKNGDYLWAYGSGGGTFTQAGGIDSTKNFVTDSLQGVFAMLFGSYFGDWDNKDNFLRAPLASRGMTLTNAWAGRPHWHFHHMALGENIGYSTIITQNNAGTYSTGYFANAVHVALMGDPTLRLHTIVPPTNVSAAVNGMNVDISWTASAETVLGYYVYRSDSLNGIYARISPSIVSGNSFTHQSAAAGVPNYYMVRSVRLQNSASGSYYNQSQGIFTPAAVYTGVSKSISQGSIRIYPNPSNGLVNIVLSNAATGSYQLQVRDALGRVVLEKASRTSSGSFQESINLESFARGFYTITVQGQRSAFTQKLLLR